MTSHSATLIRGALVLIGTTLVVSCRGGNQGGDQAGDQGSDQGTTAGYGQGEAGKQPMRTPRSSLASSHELFQRAPALPGDLWDRQLRVRAAGDDWLVYGGNLQAWRYSGLTEITKENVKNLQVAWKLPIGLVDAFETSPLVVNGVMYITTPWNHAYALDAKTGKPYWHYAHALPKGLPLCCGAVNRGVALGDGKVFMGTLDAGVIALDAQTGEKKWLVYPADTAEGYSYTVAPQVIKGKVLIATSGSDFGTRGFLDALQAGNGSRAWRFWYIPGPGEPGHETWQGDSWKHGGGSGWMPVTYDPKTNLVFSGVGNPGPDLDGTNRSGANLYTESTVAVDADSGKLKWHYQLIPHDVWDLDNVTETLIDDVRIDGKTRRVAMVAGKNGYFYVLDASTGQCVYAMQYVHKVTWGRVDPDCTPHPDERMYPVRDRWTIVYPGASGGKEWVPVAYDPEHKRLFVPVIELPHRHKVAKQEYRPGLNYWGGFSVPMTSEGYGHLTAIDVEKKAIAWDTRTKYPLVSGLACTASGLVIAGTPDQKMQIYDGDDGKVLHEFTAPSGWHSAPIVYAVDGKEYIGFANGWGGWVTGYDDVGTGHLATLPTDNTMFAFTLP